MALRMIPQFLKDFRRSAVAATGAVVVLGLVSGVTFALIGPLVDVLVNANNTTLVSLQDLLGPRLGGLLGFLGMPESATGFEFIELLSLTILGLSFVRAALLQFHWYTWELISERVAKAYRRRLAAALLDPPGFDEVHRANEDRISALLGTDLRVAREYIVHYYGGLPREAVQAGFYLITLLLLSPLLCGLFVLGVLPAGVVLNKIGKKLKKRTSKVLGSYEVLVEWLQQRLLGIETIKHAQTECREVALFNSMSDGLLKDLFRAARTKARTSPLLEFVAMAAFVLVIGYAIHLVNSGAVTPSLLISFISVLAILAQSAHKLGRYYNSNKEGLVALKRLDDVVEARPTAFRRVQSRLNQDSVCEVRNLSFRYDSSSPWILQNLQLNFEEGKIYCIKGSSGAGKSTLIGLILGLLKPSEGQVLFSANLDPENDVFYVPQDLVPAPGPIVNTITYPSSQPNYEKARQCLEALDMWQTISALPKGLDTPFAGLAETISGGQLQRLFLARILYYSAKIVVIDEGTSALDPVSEQKVVEQVRGLAQSGVTIVVVAHRPTFFDLADVIIDLVAGKASVRTV